MTRATPARGGAARGDAGAAVGDYSSVVPLAKGKPLFAALLFGASRVAAAEFVDAAARIDDLLFARVERMASRANLDVKVLSEGRASHDLVTAAAHDLDVAVSWMDVWLHRLVLDGRVSILAVGAQDKPSTGRAGYPQFVWITLWSIGARAPADSAVLRLSIRLIKK